MNDRSSGSCTVESRMPLGESAMLSIQVQGGELIARDMLELRPLM